MPSLSGREVRPDGAGELTEEVVVLAPDDLREPGALLRDPDLSPVGEFGQPREATA